MKMKKHDQFLLEYLKTSRVKIEKLETTDYQEKFCFLNLGA